MRLMTLGIVAMLASLGLVAPTSAEPSRYATDAEIQELVAAMRQRIPQLQATGYYLDRRTLEEQQERAAFTAAWGEVDPEIAPFLGDWTAIEEALMIYPAAQPGEVCIIDIYLDDAAFYRGEVIDGKVYANNNLVLVLDSGFLASIFVGNNQPNLYEYGNPRPLEDPVTTDYFAEYYPEIPPQFAQAGCLAGLPDVP
ncbi:MAG: hypothetical protein AAGE59_10950 [Cyanobacteria bacterium P01_F01_bin.86]